MILRNKIIILDTYKGKSKFPFWNELQVNDILLVEAEITRRNTNGYVSRLIIHNLRNDMKEYASFSKFVDYFNKIKYKEFQEQ